MNETIREMVQSVGVPGELIAVDESLVFRVESNKGVKAWKIYPRYTLEEISQYQRLTNRVAESIDSKPGMIGTMDGLLQFPFTWKVMPIEEVVEHNGYPLAISNYVEGPSIDELIQRARELGEQSHPIQVIENLDEGSVRGELYEFCCSLNRDLRTFNIWFPTVNTKLIDTQLVVTDVCPVVRNIMTIPT